MEIPEHTLYRSVIKRAYDDLFFPLRFEPDLKKAKRHSDDALAFLTAESGRERAEREFICVLGDVCPDALREHILVCLDRQKEGRNIPNLRFNKNKQDIDRTQQKEDRPIVRIEAEQVKETLAALAAGA